jgi:hypothetical protein
MSSPIITDLANSLISMVDQSSLKARLDRLWLGGTAGPSGGQGVRPGGFIGQLIQTISAYDTSERAIATGSGSLLDNLNHIRFNLATISGMIGSGTLTVREVDTSPTVSYVNKITFSGASVVDRGQGEVLVSISGGGAGSVTSIAFTVPSWLAVTGSPITSTGTIAITTEDVQARYNLQLTTLGLFGLVGWV